MFSQKLDIEIQNKNVGVVAHSLSNIAIHQDLETAKMRLGDISHLINTQELADGFKQQQEILSKKATESIGLTAIDPQKKIFLVGLRIKPLTQY